MKPATLNTIKAVLEGDETMKPDERKAVIEFCRCPVVRQAKRPQTGQHLTVGQVAHRWGVSLRTVRRYMKGGRLHSCVIGGNRRLPEAEVEAFERQGDTAAFIRIPKRKTRRKAA